MKGDITMKKVYMNPEMEVFELKMHQMLMAGSPTLPKSTDEVDSDDILAPEGEFDFLFK